MKTQDVDASERSCSLSETRMVAAEVTLAFGVIHMNMPEDTNVAENKLFESSAP